VAALWWPRFEAMAAWLIEQERLRRPPLARVLAETKGRWQVSAGGEPFTVTTSIDRIELGQDGSILIGDYKTGIPPSGTSVKRGEANQLPLEALIALHGALEAPVNRPQRVRALEYWKLAGNAASCKITVIAQELEPLLGAAHARLLELIARFDDPSTPYQASSQTDDYNDYEQLTRRQEWETI
jgi:ATP-dependent helicase/nuclease subunit B